VYSHPVLKINRVINVRVVRYEMNEIEVVDDA